MADHLDAAIVNGQLASPGMDAEIDITDIYAFQKPGDPSKSILIANVNPLAPTLATSFEHEALYELKIDTNGDAVADIAFRFRFSPVVHGQQTATVRMATGATAAGANDGGVALFKDIPASLTASAPMRVATSGAYKFFAGIRSDPFFFDLVGFLHGLNFTGDDFFADKNVFGIALEVPNSALGSHPKIGVWFRVLKTINGEWTQIDRMGRPAINTVFNHGDDKNTFNAIPPTRDRALFLSKFVEGLQALSNLPGSQGQYDTATATAIAEILLPDILTYDYSSSESFLNGRKLTDDVIDIELNLVTHEAVTTDHVGAHTDLLSTFPYLGHPH